MRFRRITPRSTFWGHVFIWLWLIVPPSIAQVVSNHYCDILSSQEAALTAAKREALFQYGIVKLDDKHDGDGTNRRRPLFLVSEYAVPECKDRYVIAQYFENVLLHGPYYYEPGHHMPEVDPEPFLIDRNFVMTHEKVIAELIYRLLSPRYHNMVRRTLNNNWLDLLPDRRIRLSLDAIRIRLERDGLSTRYP
jgi:hypothetical protein